MAFFSNVGLIGRRSSESTKYSLLRLISYLEKQNIQMYLDEDSSAVLPDSPLAVKTRKELAELCDLIIVVGGDGSLLSAARSFAGYDIKLLGINRGRLGFLTDISPDEIEYKVGEVLNGEFQEEERFLLNASVHREEKKRMIEFELFIDEEFVCRQRADGLIVSTPTGSTAYALSVGGPIMYPGLNAISVTPMNPHTLSSRPIVVHGDATIQIVVSNSNQLNPHVSCDGQTHAVTRPDDIIEVQKSTRLLKLIHPKAHNFFETCRSKLGWVNQTGNGK